MLAELQQRLQERQSAVAVLGMGYVGFPLALALHGAGFSVIGYDIDAKKIEALTQGKSYLRSITDAQVRELLDSGRFLPTQDDSMLAEADALLICVPTPLDKAHQPDLQHVIATVRTLAGQLRAGQLVVLESTTYPGTTQEVVKPLLEASGLVCGEDFFLAYSPEREDPGNLVYMLAEIPKIVSGVEKASQVAAETLYACFIEKIVTVSNTATAEAVKLTENIFRSVNIALANELKQVFGRMGIDIWEVTKAAATKPFGYMPFYPGPGVGGHCIPVDPYYLSWKAAQSGGETPLISLAASINERMPDYVIAELEAGLVAQGKELEGATVLLLGMAYKPEVDDVRESPALRIYDALLKRGVMVQYHDPYIPVLPNTRAYPHLAGVESQVLQPGVVALCDAALVVSGHKWLDYAMVAQHCPLVVDTRDLVPRGEQVRQA